MKQALKKCMSVFLSLLMILSLFGIAGIGDLLPEASAAATTKRTQKTAIVGSGDYIQVEYPSDIYMSIDENLSSLGNYIHITGHYGSNTNYRVWAASGIWGGQSYNVKSAWGSNSDWKGPYTPSDSTMLNNFTDYGVYSKESYHSGSTGLAGTGSYYAFDNWDPQLVFGCENPGTLDFKLYFTGTPKATGDFTYTSSGTSPLWYYQSRSTSIASWGSNISGSFDDTISFTIHVYDKSALKSAITSAESHVSTLYTATSWAALESALSAAVTVRDTADISQEEINIATDNLNDAIGKLEMSTDGLTIAKWNGSNTGWVMFGSESGDYVKSTYPSQIYVDMSETLEDAGYYVQINGHYGDNSNYSILVYDYLWGGTTSTSNCQLSNSFNNYSFDGTVNGVRGVSSSDGQSNAGNNYWKANTGSLNEKIYLLGTPKAVTADAGVQYTTSGNGGSTQIAIFRQKSGSSWSNSTVYTKDSGCSSGTATYPSSVNDYWREMNINVTIYNKATLKSAIDTALTINSAEYTQETAAAFTAAYPTAISTYAKREVTQTEINSAATALQNALDGLVRQDEVLNINKWNGSSTNWIVFGSEGGDYLKATYPGTIYLDKTETLEDAGYYVQLNGHYGDRSSFGIMVFDYIWAGASSSTSYKLTGVFPNYTFDGTVNGVRGVSNSDGQSNGYYQNTSNRTYIKWNTGTLNEKVYLIGTPSGTTANDGVTVSSSGASSSCIAFINGSTYYVKGKDDSSSSSVMDGTWREMQMTAIVYDKSALKKEINKANSILDTNYSYSALVKAGNLDTISAEIISADTTLTTREVKQNAIDASKTSLYNVASALTYGASNAALLTSLSNANSIKNEADYTINYSESSRQALETAISAVGDTSSLTVSYNAYTDSEAGAKAQANQNTIDALKTNLDNAINAMGLTAPDFSAFDTHYAAHSTLEYGICYSSATLTAYNNALNAVNALKSDSSLSRKNDQTNINSKIQAYISAYDNLVVEHDYNNVVTPPTCTEQGYTTHTCKNCSASVVDTYVNALGHSYGAWTSNNDGTHSKTCSRCNDIVTENCVLSSVVTPATCDNDGYTTHTCPDCSYSYVDSIVPATGHHWNDGVVTTPATCTENGVKTFTCTDCGATRTEVITAPGHDYASVVTPPTCTEQGYTTHTCKNCDDSYVDSYTSKLGHSYNPIVTPPTCTQQGYTTYQCPVCGDVFIGDYTNALGHTWNDGAVTTPATCTEDGVMTFTCTICSETRTEVINHTGHDYVDVVTPPTCTEKGYTTHTCANCNDSYVDSYTDPLNHAYGAWVSNNDGTHIKTCTRCGDIVTEDCATTTTVVPPTCTEKGYTLHGCPDCGYGYKDTYVDFLGHTWNDGVITTPATCTEDGVKTFTCTVCSEIKTEVVNHTGHDYVDVVTPPTCKDKGFTTHTCKNCNDTVVDTYVDALGHTWNDGVITTPATCTEDGVKTFTCTVCSEIKTEVINHTGHDYVDVVTPPTCKDKGFTTHTCKNCNDTVVDTYVDALGHTWNDGVITTPATCTEDGVKTFTCTVCSEIKTKVVNHTGHAYGSWTSNNNGTHSKVCSNCNNVVKEDCIMTTVVTAPTCTANGYTTHTCSVCGYSYKDSEVPATDHSWDNGVITTAATCTKDGVKTFTCKTCSATKTEVVNKTGHNYSAVVTAPTCTEKGYTTHKCANCNDSYVDTYVDAIGHNYTDSVTAPTCTDRGYTTHKCTLCNDTFVDSYIAALGHSWDNGVVTTPATCTQNGVKTFTCSACKDTKTEVIPAIGHDYEVIDKVAATETTNGYITYRCKNCCDEYTETLYYYSSAEVVHTLYNTSGNSVNDASLTFTNTDTGESFVVNTDKNGGFSIVLRDGTYTVSVHKDEYLDSEGTLVIKGGKAELILPELEPTKTNAFNDNSFWGRINRFFYKIMQIFSMFFSIKKDIG